MITLNKFLVGLNVFCIVCVCYINADTQIAGENDKCAAFCDDSYLKETEANKQSKESCKQGCRLFSLIQLTDIDLAVNETNTREKCSGFCSEAYPNNEQSKDACSKGCANQTVFKTGQIEVHMDGSSPLFQKFSNTFVSPAIEMMKSMQDKFQQMVDNSRNWLKSDEGIFNFFNQLPKFGDSMDSSDSFEFPRLIGGPEDVRKLTESESGDQNSFESIADGISRKMLKNLENQFAGPSVGNSDEQGEPVIVVHMIPANQQDLQIFDTSSSSAENHNDEDSTLLKETAHEPSPPLQYQYSSDDDWFACLSRRVRHLSMITRWMLCVALLLSIASMIWICLAIIRTTPRRRLNYLSHIQKGGIDNVYYTTPPATASDKTPMIIKTCDYKAQPEAPPPYEPEMSEVKVHQLQKEEKEQA